MENDPNKKSKKLVDLFACLIQIMNATQATKVFRNEQDNISRQLIERIEPDQLKLKIKINE